MMPRYNHKLTKVIIAKLKEDPEFGLETLACLRFGGECRSDNTGCRKLRGFSLTEFQTEAIVR